MIDSRPVIMRTNHPDVDRLLGNDRGFKPGLWLVSQRLSLNPYYVAMQLFNKVTIVPVDDRDPKMMVAKEIDRDDPSATERDCVVEAIKQWEALSSEGHYVPVVVINGESICPKDNPQQYPLNLRKLRQWGHDNAVLVFVLANLSIDADALRKAVGSGWIYKVIGRGYYQHVRSLDLEADGELFIDIPHDAPEVMRVLLGKRRTVEPLPVRCMAIANLIED